MAEYVPNLQKRYIERVVPALSKEFGFSNLWQVPRLRRVVCNMGLGEAVQTPKTIESGIQELATISGQKPVVTRAKKSIAGFKLREGAPIGVMVTLRGHRMWEFLERLVFIALPRVRDFRGVSPKAFDGRGNYTLGVREQIIFPEIDYDKIEKIKGLSVTFVTTARTDEHGRALLAKLGMPFRK
ncbi:MAG: 50S ribosomal protein L5 [Proteobacteria bacterium]|nr:50S ribosomal protein L5 [Pseudomonadota bacterium]